MLEEITLCEGECGQKIEKTGTPFDVTDFLPNNRDWLAFVKCIAEDNIEDLKVASKHFNWNEFLQSRDVSGVWSDCTPQFDNKSARHPFPTNPFFIAIFFNAQKCLKFMQESGLDFSKITDEHGFTAYHIMMSAIRFMSSEHDRARVDVFVDSRELVSEFHHNLFTLDQRTRMLQSVCKFGMTPISWGVFLGLANHVEYIMRYFAPNTVMNSDAVGLNEHISFDVSEFVGENLKFFTSPICVFLDLYGQSNLADIKALGIFRTGFIWRQWAQALYNRNMWFAALLLANAFFLTFATVFVIGAGVNEYLMARCSCGQMYTYPMGAISVLIYWFSYATLGIIGTLFSLRRKELYRKKMGYPTWPRRSYTDMLFWFLPWTLGIPISAFLLWLYIDGERSCWMFGEQIYPISGCCILLLLLLSVSLVVAYLRLVPALTTLMSSFYKSIGTFTVFIVLYLALTGVFTRMFQSRLLLANGSNGTRTSNKQDTTTEFMKAFYQTFMVSLNIVDTSLFVPSGDRVHLNITHILYILFVPVLFINFAIGILTSVVSHVHEHNIENRYLLMLSVAEFAEMSLASLRTTLSKYFNWRSDRIVIRFCHPMRKKSKLITMNTDSLFSRYEVNLQQ